MGPAPEAKNMPANLPPQYFEAEKKLRTAKTSQEKIVILEELLSIVPKHKGTEKLQALLKTKIAKLRSLIQKKPAVAKHHFSFSIEKSGAGQVILIGLPNSGKSTLVKALTNAELEIGDYPFTTRAPMPGMMPYNNIQIQLIDMPPITPDYMEFWHAELIKEADGILLLLDISSPDSAIDFQNLIHKLKEKKIGLLTDDQEIPSNEQLFWKKALVVANKIDLLSDEEKMFDLKSAVAPEFQLIAISAKHGRNIENLKKNIFAFLDILRVYSKSPGKKPSFEEPFVFKKGSTLMDMAKAVHKDFSRNLKFARIWGKNKYEGQKVNRDYILEDEDVIELHI